MWTLSATAVVLCYGLWAFDFDAHDDNLWYAVSMVPFTVAILRYAVDVDGGEAGEPEEIALGDRVLQVLAVAWVVCVAVAAPSCVPVPVRVAVRVPANMIAPCATGSPAASPPTEN